VKKEQDPKNTKPETDALKKRLDNLRKKIDATYGNNSEGK